MSVPVLLIVMGTSGSGKSTVGSALAQSLHCPFVDGDDLHPPSNVAKMSSGQPLDDSDREPWLRTIRETGRTLALTQNQPALHPAKELAEVYETSHQTRTDADGEVQTNPQDDVAPTKKGNVAVIACSALKLVYRRLLRGSIDSLDDPKATQPEDVKCKDVRTVHVYLDLSRQLLEERMAARKGHFMKLEMLYSQLDTLQTPTPDEPDVIIIDVQAQTTTEAIISQATSQLKAAGII